MKYMGLSSLEMIAMNACEVVGFVCTEAVCFAICSKVLNV